ncbi:hypothetical protein GCM10028781_19260 [Nostocoides australiense]
MTLTAYSVVNLSVVKHYWFDHAAVRNAVTHLLLRSSASP